MDDTFTKLGKWLGVTGQQFDILKTIHKLELEGEKTNPKNISLQYHKDYDKRIQISNLFHVLDALMTRNLIKKEAQASYKLNLDGLQVVLDGYEQRLTGELKNFKELREDAKEYLEKLVKKEEPVVKYMDSIQFFDKLADSVSRAKRHYLVALFPKLFYPDILRKRLTRNNYLEVIRQRLVEKDLEINVITDFNVDFLYRDFEHFFSSKKDALKAALHTVDQLQYLVDNYDNLKIYHTQKLVGMDMVLPIRETPRELYLYMRDQEGEIIGGIYIDSTEAAQRAYQTFTQIPKYYTLLRGAQGKRILSNLRKDIREKFK